MLCLHEISRLLLCGAANRTLRLHSVHCDLGDDTDRAKANVATVAGPYVTVCSTAATQRTQGVSKRLVYTESIHMFLRRTFIKDHCETVIKAAYEFAERRDSHMCI